MSIMEFQFIWWINKNVYLIYSGYSSPREEKGRKTLWTRARNALLLNCTGTVTVAAMWYIWSTRSGQYHIGCLNNENNSESNSILYKL